jgi:hypothetical protein
MAMIRMNVSLTPKQLASFRERSRETGASVAELIRRAIDNCPPARPKRPRGGHRTK